MVRSLVVRIALIRLPPRPLPLVTKSVTSVLLDTVPPFYPSSEDDEYIYGRGSCDAKGIAATMVVATMALRDAGVRDVGLLFVVGEEVDSAGAIVANDLESDSRYIVVGEPTENRMATGHKGGFKFKLTARGKAAHSAYPHLGESAIASLLDALAEIRNQDWGTNEVLGDATINVGTIHGGLAANVFAPEAESDVFIRVVGKVADVQAKIDRILERHPKLSYEIVNQSDAVFCETLPGFDTVAVSFVTDIPALHSFGKPLLLGPGSIHDAHTSNEKLGKREAVDAVSYYQKLVRQLLSSL
ncbi:MAG: M20/M25/M40 family metallo-hydrolase [Planctomycetes bacterium]|nr:M20/M25/M40 family metallo-hydrolase [Planctomycetota bacterium]